MVKRWAFKWNRAPLELAHSHVTLVIADDFDKQRSPWPHSFNFKIDILTHNRWTVFELSDIKLEIFFRVSSKYSAQSVVPLLLFIYRYSSDLQN